MHGMCASCELQAHHAALKLEVRTNKRDAAAATTNGGAGINQNTEPCRTSMSPGKIVIEAHRGTYGRCIGARQHASGRVEDQRAPLTHGRALIEAHWVRSKPVEHR